MKGPYLGTTRAVARARDIQDLSRRWGASASVGPFYASLWHTVRAGRVWRGELVNRRKDGTLYDEEQSITPVRTGSAGQITHFVAIKQDVSDRKRVEALLRRSEAYYRSLSHLLDHPTLAAIVVNARDTTERRQAEAEQQRLREQLNHSEKLAAMSELLAGVAHELNTPLAVVIGHAAMLSRAGDSAVASRAEKLSRAAERCGRIVKNFLALARQYPPERTSVSLNAVVDQALEVMAYALRSDGVSVVTELDRQLPRLAADAHQLQQVLVNLVGNANQAMRLADGPRRLVIRSGADPASSRVWLEVADSGPGIAPEVQARLFEPFFTTKPVGQGTGLRLSICRGIVESHGGHIDVHSTVGQGATFRVVLPVVAGAATSSPEDEPPVSARRILVVDDEHEVAEVVADMLRQDGHLVHIAGDGIEALERIGTETYDVVVSDMKMPRLDGPALWRAVRQRDPELAERFMFLTGDTLGPGTTDFIERAGAPRLEKPFSRRELRLTLAAVLTRAGAPHPHRVSPAAAC